MSYGKCESELCDHPNGFLNIFFTKMIEMVIHNRQFIYRLILKQMTKNKKLIANRVVEVVNISIFHKFYRNVKDSVPKKVLKTIN